MSKNTCNQFNGINPKLQFTMEKNSANILQVLTTIRKLNNIEYNMYRKATIAESIIHNSSCHPTEHKILAIAYLAHRMNTYPIKTRPMKKYNKTNHN
jgi:hypothetical protein